MKVYISKLTRLSMKKIQICQKKLQICKDNSVVTNSCIDKITNKKLMRLVSFIQKLVKRVTLPKNYFWRCYMNNYCYMQLFCIIIRGSLSSCGLSTIHPTCRNFNIKKKRHLYLYYT